MPCCRGSNTITKKLKATNDTFVIQSVTAAAINEKWWKSSLPSSMLWAVEGLELVGGT